MILVNKKHVTFINIKGFKKAGKFNIKKSKYSEGDCILYNNREYTISEKTLDEFNISLIDGELFFRPEIELEIRGEFSKKYHLKTMDQFLEITKQFNDPNIQFVTIDGNL